MSKKKKKKQMHVSAGTKNQVANQSKAAEHTQISSKNENEQPAEIKMNFYSAMSMLTTLFTAAAAILSIILAGRGFYYVLQTLYDETQTDINFLNDKLTEVGFSSTIIVCAYVIAGMLFLSMILSLIGTFAAINPSKKPNMVVAILIVLLCVGSIVVYLFGGQDANKIMDMFSRVPVSKHMALYSVQLIVLIVNAICSIVNIFGQKYGLKLYKEKGTTF